MKAKQKDKFKFLLLSLFAVVGFLAVIVISFGYVLYETTNEVANRVGKLPRAYKLSSFFGLGYGDSSNNNEPSFIRTKFTFNKPDDK